MSEPRERETARVMVSPLAEPADTMPPTVGDLLRYLWARRVRLLVLFFCLSSVGVLALLGWWLFAARSAHAVISLGFHGIERHEYPSGKKFSVEDLRSPKLLGRALADVGVAPGSVDLMHVLRGIDLVPIVPLPVLERWKKQDRDGAKREDFLPSAFELDVHADELDDSQRVGLIYAILKAYQATVKYELEAERHRVATISVAPPAQLAARYDYWDIPILLRLQADRLASHLRSLVRESQNFRDPTLNLGFLEVERELESWRVTDLEALAATVHRQQLVKDRDAMLQRLEERAANLEIDLKRITAQVESTNKLLEVVEQPKPVLAAQAAPRDGAPLLDPTALEKMMKSDYVGPVVRRATELHEDAATVAAARERVQREIVLLSATKNGGSATPPAKFDELVVEVASDLERIIARYLEVLDAYLDASVSTNVTLREGPYLRLPGPRAAVVGIAVLFAAAVLALLIVLLSDSVGGRRREDAGA